ncbi:MAG: T9SS type A sorting domain-containing protein [Ignavibacteriales bacterium]|nr:T9SS type A sorting domain-containing protein [Ignavibacteriales bacterium]
MKLRLLFLFIILLALSTFAQTEYPLVTIHDIQFVPDSLLNVPPHFYNSPLQGDTVRVRGVVIVRPVVDPTLDRRRVIAAGARWSIYIQDASGEPWGGLNVLQMDTSTALQGTFFDLVDTAQVVEFTGKVNQYNQSTQFELVTAPVIPVNIIDQLPKRPEPILLNISDCVENGLMKYDATKYEEMYVQFKNVTTSDRSTGSITFVLNDGNGNRVFVYDQSGFFTSRVHKLRDFNPPTDGTVLEYIRGIMTIRADGFYLVPVYPDDMKISVYPPSIATLKRNIDVIAPDQPVDISAVVKDPDGWVKEAYVFYKVNGGAYDSVAMSKMTDSTLLKGTIPGVKDSSLVSFFVKAYDNTGNWSMNPTDTVKGNYFYLVLNRSLNIQDVQYSPFGSGYGGFNNYHVTVSGVVTADTSDINGDGGSAGARVYIQNGNGPWSGIWLFDADKTPNLRRGDNITVSGLVTENNSNTRIDSISQIVVNSTNDKIPEPVEVSTADIAAKANGVLSAEKWEGVLIKYKNIEVTDDNADGNSGPNVTGNYNYGEVLVADSSKINTRVELQDGNHYYHNLWDAALAQTESVQLLLTDKFASMTGVLWQSFSNYKLVPRKNDDFTGYVPSAVDNNSNKEMSYLLAQNYPNPFNPSTTISYSIPQAGFVRITIFNMLGQEVKSLVNSYQNAGSYKVMFSANDLTTGMYLYKIQAGSFNLVKKMMLIK